VYQAQAVRAANNAAIVCAFVHIAAGIGNMLKKRWQTIQGEQTMKRTAQITRKLTKLPVAWREAEYSALRANAADTCDDRVSDDIFDFEDERAEVDMIVLAMMHDAK